MSFKEKIKSLKYSFKISYLREGFYHILFTILAIVILILIILKSLSSTRLFLTIYVLGLLFSLIIFLGILIFVSNYLLKRFSLNEISQFMNAKNPNTIIILGDDICGNPLNKFSSSYLGIRWLIKRLELEKNKSRIYKELTKKEFDYILKNENIKSIYLIGHGSKYGFCLNSKEDILIYEKYKDYRGAKKDFIHLYSCTHSKERPKTIIDYCVKEENKKLCFDADDKVYHTQMIWKMYKDYKEAKRKNKENDKNA